MTCSVEVSWQLDEITMHGTLTRPDGEGPFPAVVLVAGSGPTDRDWCSPLLPGTNGSGRLLAAALAEGGVASLRYDKRGSDPHFQEYLPKLTGKVSMRSHLEELVAAVDVLAGQDCIDAAHIAALGNSEGTLHVLHYAISSQRVPFVGIVLAAPPGRSVGQVLLSQLALYASQVPGGEELMSAVRAAADRYQAGQPMDPDPHLPEDVRKVLTSFEAPVNLPFARELWAEDATETLPAVTIPTLVVIGGKDLQVDVHADGDPLRTAAAGMTNVTFAFPPKANHVFKEENRSIEEVVAAQDHLTRYNEEGAQLDPEALDTILAWLDGVLSTGPGGATA